MLQGCKDGDVFPVSIRKDESHGTDAGEFLSGILCSVWSFERKVSVGGCNERGALEAGVATKGSSPAIEDLFWTKTILYIYIYIHILCVL